MLSSLIATPDAVTGSSTISLYVSPVIKPALHVVNSSSRFSRILASVSKNALHSYLVTCVLSAAVLFTVSSEYVFALLNVVVSSKSFGIALPYNEFVR